MRKFVVAVDRTATIKAGKVTTGLRYDEDGTEVRIETGESGDGTT